MTAIGFSLFFGALVVAFVCKNIGYQEPEWFKALFGGVFLVGFMLLFAGISTWLWQKLP